jgi:class 3 adenylate cyclase
MTPQGLVKSMNRYLSTMSEPIRTHQGVIDKYIGDSSWPIGDLLDRSSRWPLAPSGSANKVGREAEAHHQAPRDGTET